MKKFDFTKLPDNNSTYGKKTLNKELKIQKIMIS